MSVIVVQTVHVPLKHNTLPYLSSVSDSQTVKSPYSYMHNLLPLQSLHNLGLSDVGVCAMPQSEVIPFTPGKETKAHHMLVTSSSQTSCHTLYESIHNLVNVLTS